ncbi:MFS general substrate transporter [Martensiomyces pterosporus]|nr:MFS general substrate transporter [Martensiomyces pterosporus]
MSSATSSLKHSDKTVDGEKLVQTTVVTEHNGALKYLNQDGTLRLDEDEQVIMKRYIRKADIRILLFLSIGYIIFYINRSTMSFAKMSGINKDLHLKGTEYNVALSCFYIAFFVFQIPLNIVLRRVGPRVYIPTLLVLTGLFNLLTLPVTNFAGLAAMRFFEGLSQAGYLPACYYIIGTWYPRAYVPVRISYLLASAAFSGIISTALSIGFTKLKHAPMPNWKYYYLLSGLLAVLAGFFGYYNLRTYPEVADFVDDDEKELIKGVLTEQGILGTSGGIKLKDVIEALTDWHIWLYLFIEFGAQFTMSTASNWGAVFLISIKWTLTGATAISFIPQVLATITVLSSGFILRKVKKIHWCLLFTTVMTIICLAINLIGKHSRAAHTASMMLAPMFIAPSVVFAATWMNVNITGPTKSAVANAMLTVSASLSAFANSYAYLDTDAPWYNKGHAANIGLQAAVIVFVVVLFFLLRRENRNRDVNPKDISALTPEEVRMLGHKHPEFRYIL